ncbi:MAG: hypothetical protein NUV37_03350 [Nanoarchaeota archaeon]|nr:hypothetical protein [Nanoarchaeota archaeon]
MEKKPEEKIKCSKDIAFFEYIEPGTDTQKLEYPGRGEPVYMNGRQVMVRNCHDILVACKNKEGKKGILLIERKEEPANGKLWVIGGGYSKGVSTKDSIITKVHEECGLNLNEESIVLVGLARMMWKTTPNKNINNLPEGVDDSIFLFYGEGEGELKLNSLHKKPVIVTKEMYTPEFRSTLHPYIQKAIDKAIPMLRG